MLTHLRPDWEKLTQNEQWIIWREYWAVRSLPPPSPKPFFNGGQLFDTFASANIMHTTAIGGLWLDDKYRPIIAKALGVK